jgi:DNA polymerase I-like protein with 3'-5' exonuclease and polymerase domains
MQIHDELVFEIKKDDPIEIIKTFKSIMEDWPDALVPIIAEAEWTTTNWAEKKDYEFS